MLSPHRPYALSIGGFDPTGGAGVLADIKTAERLRCYAMAVLTANTIQKEDEVKSIKWLSIRFLEQQCEVIKHIPFNAIKIGIVENGEMLNAAIEISRTLWPKATLIWDPILKASDSTSFFKLDSTFEILDTLLKVDIITPNIIELSALSKKESVEKGITYLSKYTAIYLTGGHNKDKIGVDYFADKFGIKKLNPKPGSYSDKHGSGCVFSMALASHIALKYPIHLALLKSKRYIEKVLKSNKTLLAYHYQ